ncbi:MarR family winged helix-turn-helix transcriptional regulator [Nocardia bovistercoris]|uniref:Winged helix DNA-binding protein n=1 Tax=Nocardia bovistercoris TaxID=2785916 RepID=A0A931N699_9NOCA|nr:MarR family transcriptional regulator [Nocardia bovistercoris]MBH0780739.1 winged helix DNA-binding protein [Nocardia bovistercoris]
MATENPGLVAVFGHLYREVHALYQLVARRFDLTVQQVELLCLLHGDPPSLGALATALDCDKTNVTGLVDRLQRRGYLTRSTDPVDRRITRIQLTDDGITLGDRLRAAIAHELTTRLPQPDRPHLVTALRTAATALSDSRPPA